jgi:hypothetical protein
MIFDNATANRVKIILTGITNCLGWSVVSTRNDIDRQDNDRPAHNALRPDSGGYNEAFIVSYWASFGPRH